MLLAVDDLQWIDRPNARDPAASCARRLEARSLRTLATLRTGAGPTIADDEERMLVGPLGLEALTTIVSHELGHGLPRPTLRRIERMAGGNAFVALELARAAEAGRLRSTRRGRASSTCRRSGGSSATGSRRFRRASAPGPRDGRRAGGPHDVGRPRRRSSEESLLDPAFEAGVLEESGTETRFSHPLLAAAALASVTPRRRREIHARLAAIVEDPEQRARHLAAATVGHSAPVAEALDAASTQASRRGAPGAAAELSEKAAEPHPHRGRRGARRTSDDGR